MAENLNPLVVSGVFSISIAAVVVSLFFWYRVSRQGTSEHWIVALAQLVIVICGLVLNIQTISIFAVCMMILLLIHSRL